MRALDRSAASRPAITPLRAVELSQRSCPPPCGCVDAPHSAQCCVSSSGLAVSRLVVVSHVVVEGIRRYAFRYEAPDDLRKGSSPRGALLRRVEHSVQRSHRPRPADSGALIGATTRREAIRLVAVAGLRLAAVAAGHARCRPAAAPPSAGSAYAARSASAPAEAVTLFLAQHRREHISDEQRQLRPGGFHFMCARTPSVPLNRPRDRPDGVLGSSSTFADRMRFRRRRIERHAIYNGGNSA